MREANHSPAQPAKEAKAGYSPGKKARLAAAFTAALGAGVASSVPPVGAQEDGGEVPTETAGAIVEASFFEVVGPENVCGELDTLPSRVGPSNTQIVFSSELPGFSLGRKDNSGNLVILGSIPLNPNGIPRSANTESVLFVTDNEGNCIWAGYPEEEVVRVEVRRPTPQVQVGSREVTGSSRFVPEARGIPLRDVAFFPDDTELRSWWLDKVEKGFAVKGGMLEPFRTVGGQEALGRPLSQSWTDAEGYESQVFEYGILSVSPNGEITINEVDGAAVKREGKLIPPEALTVQFIEGGKLIEPYETYGSLAQGLRIDYEVMRPQPLTIKWVPVGKQEEREMLEFIQRELKEDPETSAPHWIHIVDIGHPIFQSNPGAGREIVFLGPGPGNPPVFDDTRVIWMQEDGNDVPYGPGYAPIHRTRPIVAVHTWVAINQDIMRSEIVDNPAVLAELKRNNINTRLLRGIWPHEHKWDFQVQKYKFTLEWYRTDGSGSVSRL